MNVFEQRYAPGQIHAAWFKRGSAIAVLDGSLRLTYRDASLDWLLDAPRVCVVLCEGERHVFPYEAWVEAVATGQRTASAQIDLRPQRRTIAAHVRRWLASSVARLGGMRFRRS